MKYLHHVTLDTGHVRRSPLPEVSADALRLVGEMLESALDGVEPVIPAVQPRNCTLQVVDAGRCMTATIIAPYDDDLGPGVDLITMGVASHSRCGAALWRRMHRGRSDLATDAARVPPEPWCAVRLEDGLALWPGVIEWVPDFERVLAWAWLARTETRKAE